MIGHNHEGSVTRDLFKAVDLTLSARDAQHASSPPLRHIFSDGTGCLLAEKAAERTDDDKGRRGEAKPHEEDGCTQSAHPNTLANFLLTRWFRSALA